MVSLLVFDGPDLPGPISTVSPWLDLAIRPIEKVVAMLAAQDHRRFIKTHTPLDGLVLDDRVTYIGVTRDPRDAAMAMLHQSVNLDLNRMRTLYERTVPPHERIAPQGPPRDREPPPLEAIREWMERPVHPTEGLVSLATLLHHFGSVWYRRHLPNVAAFHYADFKLDLVGELVRLGQTLGYELGRDRAEELAKHATLDAMRARASELTPGANSRLWRNKERFFRAGGVGGWQELFTEHEHVRYVDRINQLAPPDLLAWVHEGRRGQDPGHAA